MSDNPYIASPETVRWQETKEGPVTATGGMEVDGIAGVLWDAEGTRPVAVRDRDVIYRLYRPEGQPAGETPTGARGRCFISEPQRAYAVGERLMLQTRDGQCIFGVVTAMREMRTGSLSLVLAMDP